LRIFSAQSARSLFSWYARAFDLAHLRNESFSLLSLRNALTIICAKGIRVGAPSSVVGAPAFARICAALGRSLFFLARS